MRGINLRITLVVVIALVTAVMLAGATFAQQQPAAPNTPAPSPAPKPPPPPSGSSEVKLDRTEGPAGTQVKGIGTNWPTGDHIRVLWGAGDVLLEEGTVDKNGNFSIPFTVPPNATPGDYTVKFHDVEGRTFQTATFKVTQSGTGPGTGGSIDLEVTKIDPLGQRICAGSDVTFRASIRNNGSSESGFFNIRWIADNSQHFDGGHYSIPAGATDTHDHIWKNLSAGKHTLEFIADFDKQKSETDENNNQFTLPFTADNCSSGTGSPTGGAPTQPSAPKQPSLSLPWSATEGATTWYYSSGPHCDKNAAPGAKCPSNAVRYAVDFMPPGKPGCSVQREESGWVTAAQSGIVRASGNSLVEIDHGNGFRTGYYHLRSDTIQVQIGQQVGVGDKLGRPSCEHKLSGEALGTHVHFYTCEQSNPNQVCGPYAKRSTVRPIDGLVIGGWTIHATPDQNYDGTMTKPGQDTRTADTRQCGPGTCGKIRNDLTR